MNECGAQFEKNAVEKRLGTKILEIHESFIKHPVSLLYISSF